MYVQERTFLFRDICEFVKNNFDAFIFCEGSDDRSVYLRQAFSEQKEKHLVFNYDIEKESYSLNSATWKKLKTDFSKEVSENLQNFSSKNLFLDISAMPVPLIFYWIKFIELMPQKPQRVFCGYTKPLAYKSKQSELISDKYDLTIKSSIGIRTIPGFLRSPDEHQDNVIVMFLGYEGNRAVYVWENIFCGTGNNIAVPTIGFPGFQAGWHNITLELNMQFLDDQYISEYINFAAAESPFEAFNVLSNVRSENSNLNLIIAPIGTRVHSLGAALYAITDPKSIIIYDNPLEKSKRSISIDNALIYDISHFFS